MIIDTVAKTVTFGTDEKVSSRVLKALTSLLEGSEVTLETRKPSAPHLLHAFKVKSQTESYISYGVGLYDDGSITCMCPDFDFRGRDEDGKVIPGYQCKHIKHLLADSL